MNPFAWLRTATKNAFLGGIQDAVEQVAADSQAAITVKVELPALPAPPAPEKPEPSRRCRAARGEVLAEVIRASTRRA